MVFRRSSRDARRRRCFSLSLERPPPPPPPPSFFEYECNYKVKVIHGYSKYRASSYDSGMSGTRRGVSGISAIRWAALLPSPPPPVPIAVITCYTCSRNQGCSARGTAPSTAASAPLASASNAAVQAVLAAGGHPHVEERRGRRPGCLRQIDEPLSVVPCSRLCLWLWEPPRTARQCIFG